MEQNLADLHNLFEPHSVVVGIKIAYYEKTRSGRLSPSAKKIKEGILQFEGASLEECEKSVNDFINKNKVVILNER